MCGFVRARMSLAIVKSNRLLLRGPHDNGARSSRLLDFTITSDILDLTNPHISEYYRFRLYLSSAANLFFAAKASAPGILSAE